MGGPTYTVDQLKHLRDSPLVPKKPEGLPSISQWMDVPPEQHNAHPNHNSTARGARRNLRDGDAGATGDRPLINPMGQFGRRASTQPGEETVLGPPKLAFASASRTSKAADKERTGITSTDGDHLGDRFPRDRGERWTRDRDGDRNRDKSYTNGRRGGREDGEGWQNVKGRKSLNQEDFDRGFGRNGDRNRDRKEGDVDADDVPLRRGGNRDKFERWGRRDDAKEGDQHRFGTGQGGWRDRERDREKDRDWIRGGSHKVEDDPEWMDAPVDKKESKKTQEDFQRWKESMKANKAPPEEKEEPKVDPAPVGAPTSLSGMSALKTAAVHTPSVAEPHQGILFGNWGKEKPVDVGAPEIISAKPKPDKKSRFMGMFAKTEEAAAPSPAPVPMPASPEPGTDNNADKEGFQRILQMLGGATISTSQEPQPSAPAPTNGVRPGGGIPLDLFQQSPPPDQTQRQPPPRKPEQQQMLDNILAPRPSVPENRQPQQARFNSMSPDNALMEQFGLPRPDSNRPGDDFAFQQPPSRNNNSSSNNSTQDANLTALLNSRAREEANRDRSNKDRERQFLLELMQQPRSTPPQIVNQNIPRQAPHEQNMSFYDHPAQRPQGQPKGHGGPPPGFMEGNPMFSDNEAILRREQEFRHLAMQQQQQQQQQQHEAMRAKGARMPMGYSGHDDPALAGLQRRNTAGEIPRQMTNMGIPSQSLPDMPYMGGRGQPGIPPTPNERPNIAPPPGLGSMRPPGLGGPGPQQGMGGGGPNFSAGNTPLGHPPNFPPPSNMRGFPGPQGPQGPQSGPPGGFFPPSGFPYMGMRGNEDPRMMFEGQFGPAGPGGPRHQQQGRSGPPPNMY